MRGRVPGRAAALSSVRCGVEVRLLELAEGPDEPETLVLLDCPQGHVHATLTRKDVATMLSAEVRKRLRLMP